MLLIWEESDNVILTKKSWPINPRHLIHGMPWMVRDWYLCLWAHSFGVNWL